mmetsp:Transcript_65985/g.190355  ORF Transcript_65985/g.190355 Transcript_65985/m.190355 type:complete len:239 (+) Transcript_65985:744-1460(+)
MRHCIHNSSAWAIHVDLHRAAPVRHWRRRGQGHRSRWWRWRRQRHRRRQWHRRRQRHRRHRRLQRHRHRRLVRLELLDLLPECPVDRLEHGCDPGAPRATRVEQTCSDEVGTACVAADAPRLGLDVGRTRRGDDGRRVEARHGTEEGLGGGQWHGHTTGLEQRLVVVRRQAIEIPAVAVLRPRRLFHPDGRVGEVRPHQDIDEDVAPEMELEGRKGSASLVLGSGVHPVLLAAQIPIR